MEQLTDIITQELQDKIKLFNPCEDGIPAVGTKIKDIPQENLIWAEDVGIPSPEIKQDIPVWVMCMSGSGSGYGYGYGSGYGYGDGYGYGSGYGSGSGSGYAEGYKSG